MLLLTKTEMIADIEKTIKTLRAEMILIGTKEGLTSEKTINLSQKLDYYIFWIQKYNN